MSCPVCYDEAQSECCAVAVQTITKVKLNRAQRSATAKAARAMAPKLSVIEFLFGVEK